MLIEMAFDLPLGLGDEAEADAIAEGGRERADGERSGIPERIEQAGAGLQLGQARSHQARWSVSSRAACSSSSRVRAERATKAWP